MATVTDLTVNNIIQTLTDAGFPCSFGNSGGGVYCIYADVIDHPVGVVGSVCIGTGEWFSGMNMDEVEQSVTLCADGPDDMVTVPTFAIDGLWQDCIDLQSVLDAAIEAADAVRGLAHA